MQIEIPKANNVSDERYFNIRNCDARGCGSFYSFAVTPDTSIDEIIEIAVNRHTDEMNEEQRKYYPSIFTKPPAWRPTVKVVELSRKPYTRSDGTSSSEWKTLRGGLKFTIVKNSTVIKTNLRTTKSMYYSFGEIISKRRK